MIETAAQLLRDAENTVVLTGAGTSTPSGIPDFRSTDGGLWQKYNPMEVASLSVFRVKPERFFEWFRPFTKVIVEAAPNPAHQALAKMEQEGFIQTVITQNIDGLHQRAGSKTVLEVHGTIDTLSCGNCFSQFPSGALIQPFIDEGTLPICTNCGRFLKPDVILFEEQLPVRTWQAVARAVEKCDLMIVAGSSLEVIPVARLPFEAVSHGARLIIINNTPTYIDPRADVVINQNVAEVLPSIADALTD